MKTGPTFHWPNFKPIENGEKKAYLLTIGGRNVVANWSRKDERFEAAGKPITDDKFTWTEINIYD